MQDWDSRIENLKANINDARKRWVLPYLEEVKVEMIPATKKKGRPKNGESNGVKTSSKGK